MLTDKVAAEHGGHDDNQEGVPAANLLTDFQEKPDFKEGDGDEEDE